MNERNVVLTYEYAFSKVIEYLNIGIVECRSVFQPLMHFQAQNLERY